MTHDTARCLATSLVGSAIALSCCLLAGSAAESPGASKDAVIDEETDRTLQPGELKLTL